jgi:hypothetical protein
MPTNSQLLYAILSMDSYHRGVEGGLLELVGPISTQIDDTLRETADSNASIGFSAQSYTRGAERIIVYRGTDDGGTTNPFTRDFFFGFFTAAGTRLTRTVTDFDYRDVIIEFIPNR